MASNFLFIGWNLFLVTQKPRYYLLVCTKNDFDILYLSPFYLRFCRVSSNFSRWSDQLTLVIINRSPMYTQIKSNPWNIPFILFWKMSRELLTSIVRCLYWYFTHGKIIVYRLFASLLRRIWEYTIFNSSDESI